MSNVYLTILSVGGLLIGLLVFGTIYVDTSRRGVSGLRRLLLAVGLGISCLGSFLVPYAYEEQLRYTYFQLIKPRPIAVSPYEWMTVSIVTGLLISVIAVGFYFVGTRYTTLQTTSDVF